MKCPHCNGEIKVPVIMVEDDGSRESAEEFEARMHPSDYPFGVQVSPKRRAYLNKMNPGDGPE